ncbi:hypothetical protein Tco_1104385 [Tanacetum coccineum]
MSTLVFVDPEISTQADGAQSSRVPVPLSEDPYEAIRQDYLVEMDTESEPFEDIETETPESPYTVASPTSLPDSTRPTCHVEESEGSDTSGARSTSTDSTTPLSPDHPVTHTTLALVPSLRRTARMAVRILPALSPSLSASIAEVATMSDPMFRSSELVGDDEEYEDEEVEEILDSNSESEDTENEGPTARDKGLTVEDEGLTAGDEGPGMRVKSYGLGGDEVVPKGQYRVAPVIETAVGEPLGLGYGALRCQEIASRKGHMPSPTLTTWIDPEDGRTYIDIPVYPLPALLVQTPPSPEWSSGSLPISPAPFIVPLPISSPMISLTVPSPVASPATIDAEGFLTELGA